jgi:hypothetical protein
MACLPIYLTDGASERFSATIKPLLSRHEMWWQWRCPMADPAPAVETFLGRADCVFGTEWQRSKIKAVLWGNSHAEHLTPIVEIAAMESDASVALWPASCLPFVGKDGVKMMWNGDPIHMSEKCGSARDQFISKLDEHPEISVVILAANWAAADGRLYREDLVERNTRSMEFLKQGLQELVDRISRPGRRVILVGDVPFNGLDLRACFLAESGPLLRERCPDRYNISRAQFDHYNKAADEILKSIKGAEAVILGDRMCGPTMCETVVRGEFLYRDNDHWRRNLTEETNRELSLRLGIRQSIFQPLAAS